MMNRRKNLEKKILAFLNGSPNQSFKARELARKLDIPEPEYRDFRDLLGSLAEEDKITRHKGNRYGKFQGRERVEGILHVKTQGYGFVIREEEGEDVFVSQRNMGSALHHDRVEVELWAQPVGKLPEGRVVRIVSRGRENLVGVFQEGGAYHYVIPDNLKITRDIYVSEADRGGAGPGQKVVVEILDWGDAARMPEGRVTTVLGYADDPDVDVLSVMHGFGLPDRFPKAVEREAAAVPGGITDSETARRLDLRKLLTFTIDPDDAKDFDDAVSLEILPNGNRRLGVHIADVSHYVVPGSAMDTEALRRGTSVYLVDRVVPMLPERLSNELCSLRPETDRLAFSVLIEITPEGEVLGEEIRESLIHSHFRLSYTRAQALIDGKESGFPEELVRTLRDMQALSQILFGRWRAAGHIDFDAPEPKIVLDAKGRPLELTVRERLESHRLVEAFMLLANQTVAESVHRLRRESGRKYPFVYRVHEKPSGKKLDQFLRFVGAMGHPFDPGKKLTPAKLQRFLEGVRDTRHETVIRETALRSMMKAQYTTANVGHFGLAFKQYTHFTSPIRRYPDLAVHRLLKAYGSGKPEPPKMAAPLSGICKTATEREINAAEAERESIRAKQIAYMSGRIGEEYDAVISGVTGFGFFAEIPEILVEGLVKVEDLRDDYYLFDETRLRLVGQRTRRIFQLGDPVRVRVTRVLKDLRKVDFGLVEALNERTDDRNSAPVRKKRGKRRGKQKKTVPPNPA